MIADLLQSPDATTARDADVLVIGGGVAGLLAATRLARAGRRVIVAESGGMTQAADTHPLNAVEQIGDIYAGAEHGRFRCLGGTSTRWGGAMLPFAPMDFTTAPHGWNAPWPFDAEHLLRYRREVEQLFSLGDAPYDFPDVMPASGASSAPFLARRAKWPPFRLRNVATLLAREIRAAAGPEIWLNATATRFSIDASGRFGGATLQAPGDRSLTVTAREVVIAAGAVESTRLLLLADRQSGARIFASDDVLGRYFFDHLSLPMGRLEQVRETALNRVVGFSFEGAIMRNLRFEPDAGLRAARNLPAGFAHIVSVAARPTGFDALREVYRRVQRRAPPAAADVLGLARAAPWLARAVWWRFVERRLLFPDGAEFLVQMVAEQEPRRENRITLSPARVDVFGCPLAAVDWRAHDNDAANMLGMTEAFVSAWNAGPLVEIARAVSAPPADVRAALAAGGGIYHPGGSVRLGAGPSVAVLDSEFRAFRAPNVTVLSTAAFPTGGGANPTMMLMMAALRAADRLAAMRV
jgi:choline dehydrogenase-like flavoprotein